MKLIHIESISKHFKILNRREGLDSAFRDVFQALIFFSPLTGIGLFAVTHWIWTPGVNSYTGTGS